MPSNSVKTLKAEFATSTCHVSTHRDTDTCAIKKTNNTKFMDKMGISLFTVTVRPCHQ